MTARAIQVEGIAGGVTIPVSGTFVTVGDFITPADNLANTDGLPVVAQNEGWDGATWDRLASGADNADGVAALAAGVQRVAAEMFLRTGVGQWTRAHGVFTNLDGITALAIEAALQTMAAAYVYNGASWDRVRGDTTAGMRVAMGRATLVQAGNPAANTALTLTLAAPGAGLFHFITHIYIARVATAALAGGAILEITTTNLNGIRWVTGNQHSITVATTNQNVVTDADYTHPLRSAVANTATTIVMPAPGAAVSWRAWCAYYTAPHP